VKVTYIGSEFFTNNAIFKWNPGLPFPLFGLMPVELRVCLSLEDLKSSIEQEDLPDVFFLESPTWIDYAEHLRFLNDYDVPIAAFHADIWQKKLHWFDILDVDLHVGLCGSVVKMISDQFTDDNYLFLPHYMNPYLSQGDRDIDVLFWGWVGRQYPFRAFVLNALADLAIDCSIEVESKLYIQNISLRGKTYKYARLHARVMDELWYGQKLYNLLRRARICPTGPVQVYQGRIAVGKYFENMACGALVITCPVDDADILGFKHKENIFFTCEECFEDDLAYLLTRPDMIERIGEAGMNLIAAKHTTTIRAQQLYIALANLIREKKDGE
jgi:hypothetical protein